MFLDLVDKYFGLYKAEIQFEFVDAMINCVKGRGFLVFSSPCSDVPTELCLFAAVCLWV